VLTVSIRLWNFLGCICSLQHEGFFWTTFASIELTPPDIWPPGFLYVGYHQNSACVHEHMRCSVVSPSSVAHHRSRTAISSYRMSMSIPAWSSLLRCLHAAVCISTCCGTRKFCTNASKALLWHSHMTLVSVMFRCKLAVNSTGIVGLSRPGRDTKER